MQHTESGTHACGLCRALMSEINHDHILRYVMLKSSVPRVLDSRISELVSLVRLMQSWYHFNITFAMDTCKRDRKCKQRKEAGRKTHSRACTRRNKDDVHSKKKRRDRWRRWLDVYFLCMDNSNVAGLDSVVRCNDSAVAIPDKLDMTEALKSADSSHFGDRAHLFWGRTERGRNLSDQKGHSLTLLLPIPVCTFIACL